MKKDEKYLNAVELLRGKHSELNRLPKRSDFTPQQACFIKQKLGPWPRALEMAGLKEAPEISSKEKNRLRRARLKRSRKISSSKASEKKEEQQ